MLAGAVLAAALGGLTPAPATAQPVRDGVLILYDDTGPWEQLGELYGIETANLVGRFTTATAQPADSYTAGAMEGYLAAIYIGSTFDEPLPPAFLADVLAATTPVVWIQGNVWQLERAAGGSDAFVERYGWRWWRYDTSPIAEVRYKGRVLTRHAANRAGVMDYALVDRNRVEVVAEAVREDGTGMPWALRSSNLTYLGEVPYLFTSEQDRYLVWADMLYDLLAPDTPERHRALVRIEDVGPTADPDTLRAIADALAARGVPFSVAVYPVHVGPPSADDLGMPQLFALDQRPEVVDALRYMQQRGGTLVLHGRTHQLGSSKNPYTGTSGADLEFYRAHVDGPTDTVVLDGPVHDEEPEYARRRLQAAIDDLGRVGLDRPAYLTFPHYAAAPVDYVAVTPMFTARYGRALYFPGLVSGGRIEYEHATGQLFPYPVTDVYGARVLPENLGNYSPVRFNQHRVRQPAEVVDAAATNLVVRDGWASFFFHHYLELDALVAMVDGIAELGYEFVSLDEASAS